MLIAKVYSAGGRALDSISEFQELIYTGEINTLSTLEFSIFKGANGVQGLQVENYIKLPVQAINGVYDTEYVIKEVRHKSDGIIEVYAVLNVEPLKAAAVPAYDGSVNGGISGFVAMLELNTPVGWSFDYSGNIWEYSNNSIATEAGNVWEAILKAAETGGANFLVDQAQKKVTFYPYNSWKKTTPIRLFDGITLNSYESEHDSSGVITKICPIGKDGLLLDGTQYTSGVPNNNNWLTDTSKYSKVVSAFVNFGEAEDVTTLRSLATEYLASVCAPTISYTVSVYDLQRMTGETAYTPVFLGTACSFYDKDADVVVSAMVRRLTLDLLNPVNNEVELASQAANFANSAASERKQLTETTAAAKLALEIAKSSGGGGSTAWADITGKPSTFPPSSHTHTKAEITDFAHTHTKSQITDFAHNHDERYYTESEIDTKLSAKQATLVSGTNIATINGQSLLDGGDIEIQGGGGAGGSLPAVSLGKKDNSTGTQSIGTTITKLNIGTTTTVNSDTAGAYFEVTAGQIKCLKAGVVVVSASVYVSHSSTSGYESLFLYKNGSEQMSDTRYSTGITTTLNLTTMIAVSAGDYFDIRGRANASSTFYTNNRATTLDIMYLNIEPQKEATGYTLKVSNNNAYWNFNIVLADGTTVAERAGTSGTSVYDNVQYFWCAQDAGLRFSKVTNFEEHYNGVVTQKSNDNYVFYNGGAELWLTEDMEIISTWNDD